MIKYLLSTFRGGISYETDRGPEGSWKNSYALDIHKRTDSLTTKQAMATVFGASNTTMTGHIQFFVPASDGTTYCFGSTGSIFAMSGTAADPVVTFVYNDENGGISGAAEWKLSTGTDYLFWATATSVARKELAGADITPDSGTARWTDATQDWKPVLTAQSGDNPTWHTMKNAGGVLNIANGNSLATVDFDGNFIAAALNIRPFNLIKCIEERDDYVLLGSYRTDNSEEGYLWSWIITATNFVQKKRIPVKGLNAIINTELLLIQGGTSGELFFSDFNQMIPLNALDAAGSQVMPGGVSIEGGIGIFGVFGGSNPGLWSYGRKRDTRPYALNYDYRLASTVGGSTISTIAAVAMLNGVLTASWGTTDGSTSDYGIDQVSSTTKANAIFESLEFDNGTPAFQKPFNVVRLLMTPLPSGTSVAVRFKLNYESAWRYAVLGDGTTTYSVTNATEAEFAIGKAGEVYEVGLDLNASVNATPEILAITTYLSDEFYEHG